MRADYYALDLAVQQGLLLPSVSAAAFEQALNNDPTDLVTRARLLGYYKKNGSLNGRRALCRLNHILWFIDNVPSENADLKRRLEHFHDLLKDRSKM